MTMFDGLNNPAFVYSIPKFRDASRPLMEKSGVALTQLSLPYITVEEYFIISITFIFNLYFLCFVVDELPALIVIVNIF